MTIQTVEVHRDVGAERAAALLSAIRDAGFVEYLADAERDRVVEIHGRERTQEDALWLAQKLLEVASKEEPKVKSHEVDDGVNPNAR